MLWCRLYPSPSGKPVQHCRGYHCFNKVFDSFIRVLYNIVSASLRPILGMILGKIMLYLSILSFPNYAHNIKDLTTHTMKQQCCHYQVIEVSTNYKYFILKPKIRCMSHAYTKNKHCSDPSHNYCILFSYTEII